MKKSLPFAEIRPTFHFEYEGRKYMKLDKTYRLDSTCDDDEHGSHIEDGDVFNSVSLEAGSLHAFDDDDLVNISSK